MVFGVIRSCHSLVIISYCIYDINSASVPFVYLFSGQYKQNQTELGLTSRLSYFPCNGINRHYKGKQVTLLAIRGAHFSLDSSHNKNEAQFQTKTPDRLLLYAGPNLLSPVGGGRNSKVSVFGLQFVHTTYNCYLYSLMKKEAIDCLCSQECLLRLACSCHETVYVQVCAA